MTTEIIIRADDLTGTRLRRMATWFEDRHPTVPCSVFAYYTDTRWTDADWQRAGDLVTERGWEVGGHTRDHPMLSLLSEEDIRTAIARNVDDIEDGLAEAGVEYSVTSFAYPCGDYDDRVVDVMVESDLACGLTFPDGFPYRSAATVPEGRDRYRWGVTHAAKFALEVWNSRFDRVHEQDGCYVFCFHPDWWWSFEEADPLPPDADHPGFESEWDHLDEHLAYLKAKSDIRFVTYADLVG